MEILLETFQQRERFAPAVKDSGRTVVNHIGLPAHVVDVHDGLTRHECESAVKIVPVFDAAPHIMTVAQIDDNVGIVAVLLFGLDVAAYDHGDFRAAYFDILATFRRGEMKEFVARIDRFFTDIPFDLPVLDQGGYADCFVVRALGGHADQHGNIVAIGGDLYKRIFAQVQKRDFVEQVVGRSAADGLLAEYQQVHALGFSLVDTTDNLHLIRLEVTDRVVHLC